MDNEISPKEFTKLHPDYELLISLDKEMIVIRKNKKDMCWVIVGQDIDFTRLTTTLKELQDITMLISYFYNRKEK